MREKPVPVRVGKELKENEGFSPMEVEHGLRVQKLEDVEKDVKNTEQNNIASKDLPSMVSIVALNAPHVYDVNNTDMFQQTFQLRSQYDSPDHFEFLDNESVSESQKQAVKFGVRVFRDWLARQGSTLKSLEDMSRQEIASALEQFYLTAKRPNGSQYKKNTLKSIKHSLDLYFRSSPLKKDFSISSDFDFRQVNRTLDNLPEDADNNRFPQCTMDTILKLYKSGQLGLVTTEDPQVLIQTVWFYIASYFFSNIDKRMLRELTGAMLILAKDDAGMEYYWLNYKTPDRCRSDVRKARIYAKAGSLCCPVAIIKKYMEHRNPRNEVLFQHPKKISDTIWYSHLPLGKNKHMDIIKAMCINAGVDPPLTGRCIRSYVQELLRDCDQVVNNMFQLGSITTVQTVILPKVPNGNPSQVPIHQIAPAGVPKITINSPVTNMKTSPVQTIVVRRNPELPVTSTTMGMASSSSYSNSNETSTFIVPYQSNATAMKGPQCSVGKYGGYAVPVVTSNTGLQTCLVTSDKTPVNIGGSKRLTLPLVDTSTQTEGALCSGSAYNKADLKTKNKMRLQARKSLLSFLEELNEISDGHGTELFHEIVQEDMNMWKSIAATAK